MFSWLVFAALSATACSGAVVSAANTAAVDKAGTHKAGELRVSINSDVKTMEPGGRLRDVYSDTILLHVVEGLVAYRDDFSIAPVLAQSYEVGDQGRTYTFHLRSGRRFHNGAIMTSADVKWSWERMLDPRTGWVCREWYDGSLGPKLLGVETPDSQTVVFRLAEASPLFLENLASFQCMASVLHRESVAQDGSWKSPVGTGPYRLAEWKKGEYILLRRFDDYVPVNEPASGLAGRKEPRAERVRWIIVPEKAAQKAGLLAGQIDVLPALAANDLPMPTGKAKTLVVQGQDWAALLLQTQDPLLRNVSMRRAIASAINTNQLAGSATRKIAAGNPSVIPTSSPWYSKTQSVSVPYDPQAAARLAKEAGYRGEKLKLQTNKRFESMYTNAVILQSMLQKVGINVELEVLDWAAQLANYREGKFQLMSFAFTARTDPSLIYMSFIGDKTKGAYYQWDDRKAEQMVRQIATQTDRAQRQGLMDQLHELMVAQVPIVPLYNPPIIDATGVQVSGYQAWPAGRPRLWNVSVAR
jgi:peptide/nickel transport system substrate-binding protein